jgi:integrase
MEYKVSHRKKDGGYQAIVSYKARDGRWRQKTRQGYSSISEVKKGCDDLLMALKKDYKREFLHENEKLTLGEFVEVYMEDVKPHLSQNSIRVIRFGVESLDMDDTPMCKITHSDIQGWVNDMMELGYKYNTIKTRFSVVKTVFNKAVNPYRILDESPMDDIKLPKREEVVKVKAFTESELASVLSAMKSGKDYIICLIASSCGLRIGEILGLTVSDIDLKENIITVDKQWKLMRETDSGTWIYGFGDPKSKNSFRKVPIPPSTSRELAKYISNTVIGIDGRIFPKDDPKNASNRVRYKIQKMYPDMNFHSLRHTYATTLVANGVDFKTIAMLLGDTVEMVLKVYSHVTEDMFKSATDKINGIFG